MNNKLFGVVLIGSALIGGSLAFGNPATLPNHPGYPMGDAKDPVVGMSLANDPGQSPPSHEESLQGAGQFHDSHSVNTGKEMRPNIVAPGDMKPKSMESQSESKK